MARAHVRVNVVDADGVCRNAQRRITLIDAVDDWPLILLDELLVTGPGDIDHVMWVNAHPDRGDVDRLAGDRSWIETVPAWNLPIQIPGQAQPPEAPVTDVAPRDPTRREPDQGFGQARQWQQGGPVSPGDSWQWSTEIGAVTAIALSSSAKISTFHAPAWRTYAEIQAAPSATWRSVVLRQQANQAGRVLYLIGQSEPISCEIDNGSGCVVLQRRGTRRSLSLPAQLPEMK